MADTQSYIQGLQNAQNLLNQIQTKLGELKAQQSTPAPPTPPSLSSSTSAASYSTPSGAATYSTPSTTVPSSAIQSSYTGSSIVDYLNLTGQPSDFSSRAKLAQQYGIPNYTGTAAQNTQLLNLLRSGSTPSGTSAGTSAGGYSQPVSQPTSSMSTASQLAALQSQLADVQAQKDALVKYGLTDTSQLVKSSSGEYIPAKYDTLETNLTERAKSYLDQYLQPIDYDSLATQAKKMVEQNYASLQDSLNQVVNNIKAQYDAAKQDLLDAQVLELEDLKGEYSVRGLLDSGAYTEAKRKLQESQKKELADLEQKESQDIANLHYSMMSKMPDQIVDITNSLAQELQRRRNEALSLLGTLLSYQQQQEEGRARQEEVASTVEVVNEKGERYIVLLNSRGQEIGRIYAGKSTPTATSTGGTYNPGNYTENELKKLRAAGIDPTDIKTADAYLYLGIEPPKSNQPTNQTSIESEIIKYKNQGNDYETMLKEIKRSIPPEEQPAWINELNNIYGQDLVNWKNNGVSYDSALATIKSTIPADQQSNWISMLNNVYYGNTSPSPIQKIINWASGI